MKISRMNIWENKNTRAFFDLETQEGIIIKGFKIVDGKNGLFVSFPSKKSKKDGKFNDEVFMPRELRDQLNEIAIKEYAVHSGKNISESSTAEDGNVIPF